MIKKMYKFLMCVTVVFSFAFVQGQSLKTYSGTKKVDVNRRGANRFDCKEVYQYYVGEDGSYIKSGSYSLSGTKTINSDGPGSGNVTESYSVSATFKDGYLNGKLTAKMSVKGYMSYTLFTKWNCNVEVSLSCNFKDGIPDGQWTYTERGEADENNDDKNIYKTIFNCKDGYFVGDFDINFARNYLIHTTKMKGHFDPKGNLLSLTMRGGKSIGLDYDLGVKEYTFSSDRQLLSYIHRGIDNKSRGYYKLDEELFKQNPADTLQWFEAMKKNGYIICNTGNSVRTNLQYECNYTDYANKEHRGPYGTDCYGTYFSTYDIIKYIYNSLMLEENVGGTKESKGLFNRYNIIIIDKLEKFPVKELTESQFQQLIQTPTDKFYNDYTAFLNNNLEEHDIMKQKGIWFLKERDTLLYFTEKQREEYYNASEKLWKERAEENNKSMVLETAKRDLENSNWGKKGPEEDKPVHTISYSIDSLWKTADSLYHCLCRIDYQKVQIKEREWITEREWKTAQSEIIYKVTYSNVFYLGIVGEARIQDGSFSHWKHIDNDWDVMKKKDEEILVLSQENKDYLKTYQKMYKNADIQFNKEMGDETALRSHIRIFILMQHEYLTFVKSIKNINTNSEIIMTSAKEEIDIAKTYQGFRNTWNQKLPNEIGKISTRDALKELSNKNSDLTKIVAFQNHCMNFIAKRKTISSQTTQINTNTGKDYADVLKSFASFQKNYNLTLSSDTSDNHTRLDNFINIQDSCLTFIELRKTITQNNVKIASYVKKAPSIVKTYNTHMKGVDLTWNQESGRNQAIREIIQMQNELIGAFSKPNISEIDKTVKKSKAKTWEEVKKIVLQ